MNFLCIYLGEKRGGALMHVYEWEHIVSLYYRTAQWMFTKLGRDEECSWSLTSVIVFGQIRTGADPGRGQNRSRGSPSLTNFFFRLEGYSNKSNANVAKYARRVNLRVK